MLFVRRAPALFPGLSLRMPSIPTTISTRYFFDRTEVKNALSAMEYKALTRASMLVRRTAQKSIKKVGAARPQLKIMRDNPGVPMSVLVNTPGLRSSIRRGLELRIRELKFPPSSPPGTPPYTHVPYSHMLGFRRNLYNAYDPASGSAVVGPSKKGKDWGIPHLHEFGGSKVLRAWVWQPKYPRYTKPIVKWTTANESPGGGNWLPTGQTKAVRYPPRPFMLPALNNSRTRIAKMFEGTFSAGRVGSP
jgi:hypothetical protein